MSRNQINHPYGEQVLRVEPKDGRALGIMPRDVEIVAAIASPADSSFWTPERRECLYLHIRCTIAFDRPEKSPLTIEDLFDFYQRYISIRRDWASKLEADLSFYQQTGFGR